MYGVPVGTDNYVKHMLMQKLDELTERAEMSCSVLGEEKQTLWTTVRASLSQYIGICWSTLRKSKKLLKRWTASSGRCWSPPLDAQFPAPSKDSDTRVSWTCQ